MLRGPFRYFQPASLFIILPVLLVLLWLPSLIDPIRPGTEYAMPFYLLLEPLNRLSLTASSITALILVWMQAVLLNSTVNRYEVFSQRTSMVALVYVLVVSSLPGLRTLHPVHPAALLVIAALYRLFSVYRQHTAFSQVFDAGVLIALASLFYLPCALLFLVLWVFLAFMRPFIWREYALALIGLLLPYLFVGTFYYLFDRLEYLTNDLMLEPFLNRTYLFHVPDRFLVVLLWLMVLFLAISVPGFLSLMSKSIVRSQNLQLILTWMFLIAAAAVFQTGVNVPSDYAFVAIPFSIPVANFFLTVRRGWIAEILLMVWAGMIALQSWQG